MSSRSIFTEVVNRYPTVGRLGTRVVHITTASTGMLVAKRGNAKGSIITRTLRRLSGETEGPFMGVSLKYVPRGLFRDRLFKCRGKTFASTEGTGRKQVRATSNNALFLSRVKGLGLPVRRGLLAIVRGQRARHVNSGGIDRISIEVLTTAGTRLHRGIKRKAFQRSLFCQLGAVRLRLPPVHRHKRSVILLTRCFLGVCSKGCDINSIELKTSTGRGLLGRD